MKTETLKSRKEADRDAKKKRELLEQKPKDGKARKAKWYHQRSLRKKLSNETKYNLI